MQSLAIEVQTKKKIIEDQLIIIYLERDINQLPHSH